MPGTRWKTTQLSTGAPIATRNVPAASQRPSAAPGRRRAKPTNAKASGTSPTYSPLNASVRTSGPPAEKTCANCLAEIVCCDTNAEYETVARPPSFASFRVGRRVAAPSPAPAPSESTGNKIRGQSSRRSRSRVSRSGGGTIASASPYVPTTPNAMAASCTFPPSAMAASGIPAASAVRHERRRAARCVSHSAAGNQATNGRYASTCIHEVLKLASIQPVAPRRPARNRSRSSFRNANMKSPPASTWPTTKRSWFHDGETKSASRIRTG